MSEDIDEKYRKAVEVINRAGGTQVPVTDKTFEILKSGQPDILMVPVGGNFTIDAAEATQVADQLSSKIVIPMHFKTDKLGFPIAGREEFLRDKTNVEMSGKSEIDVSAGDLTGEQRIIALDPSL